MRGCDAGSLLRRYRIGERGALVLRLVVAVKALGSTGMACRDKGVA